MLYVLEQIFVVMSKLIEHILDWPFLLFVFLVWTIIRFRDQIGSMLDRRSAPGSEGLPRKVRKELAGFENTIGKLNSEVSDLQSQMRRVEDVQSLDRFERSLKPVRTATKDLEINIKSIENQLVQLANRGIHDQVAESLAPISAQIGKMPEEIRRLEELIESRAETEAVSSAVQEIGSLKSALDPIAQELENLRHTLDGKVSLESYRIATTNIENLQLEVVKLSGDVRELINKTGTLVETGQFDAVKNEISVFDSRLEVLNAGIANLKNDLQSAEAQLKTSASAESLDKLATDLKNVTSSMMNIERKIESYKIEEEFGRFSNELSDIRKLADGLSNSFNSAPWNESAEQTRNLVLSIQARVDGINANLETLATQASESPSSEALLKMLEDSGMMRFEINKLKESVDSAIANKTDAGIQAETVSSELARITSEIETLKEGLRTLPLLPEVHGSAPKAKKKKK